MVTKVIDCVKNWRAPVHLTSVERLSWINQTNIVSHSKYINGEDLPKERKIAYIAETWLNHRGLWEISTISRVYRRILRDLIENEYNHQEEEEQENNVFCLNILKEN